MLVVEDSATMRRFLVEALSADSEIEVVGEDFDGSHAVDLCTRLKPDVITLDMMMPGRNGLQVTEEIMAYCPTPIVICSASINRAELFKTYDALAAGAVDVIEKPRGDDIQAGWSQKFLSTVKLVSRIKVVTHLRAKLDSLRGIHLPTVNENRRYPPQEGRFLCMALGLSTGGPSALMEVLKGLPKNFPVPILVVIHIGKAFGTAFADWLNMHSPIPVLYPKDGDSFPARGESKIFLAPPDKHLLLKHGRFLLSDAPERHSCRPSVDILFESVAHELSDRVFAGVMTGMGRDGAAGLLAIRRAGGSTFAQDEATSTIFGMPREAAQLGAAQRVLPLPAIAPTLIEMAAY